MADSSETPITLSVRPEASRRPDDEALELETPGTRARIIAAAARLIGEGGRDAATTRAVAATAGVQAPTLYRLFGDKQGLLDAVAEAEIATYMAGKAACEPHPDPLEDLREGWDRHVAFGLANPGLFAIMAGETRQKSHSPAVEAGIAVLRARVHRVALSGRLRMPEERAVLLIHAAGTGTVLALLGQPEAARDPGLSTAAREAALAAMTGEAPAVPGPRGAAMALRASLDGVEALSPGERHLMRELLDRIAGAD
ncbi:TetR/AcrR family transcriptional regulator [Rubellimicrobium rubrum]|uniref:TetR/AcrR family transcriptional regulator n=1 Tax=Rubellimicrobium rubrum TaxID=2585369 RepID=A0A5C4MWP3_9RHOB|nr:TetR/AcrR family transcriptional regulator [Rubellimicrobium rubrum]TNC49436.1 TetR/AcrR family transcriptional regulator [Rubellimicrobium rubrum]